MYIFDFENTLANSTWREKYFPTKKDKEIYTKKELSNKYDEAHSYMYQDQPKINNCVMYSLCCYKDTTIILTAVRDVLDHRQQIEVWLDKWKFPQPAKIIMRPKDNFQSSPDFKLSVVKELNVLHRNIFVFDDREDVIQKMLENGIPGVIVS